MSARSPSRPRPTVKRGVADRYASPGETIVEVYSRALGKGCLLSVRETPDGTLILEAYRADPGVFVRVNRVDYPQPT